MPKDLATQLAELEDAERRIRPLVTDARAAIKDLKSAMREARELASRLATDALKGEMGKLIEHEMDDIVPSVERLKASLSKELSSQVQVVVELLDQVSDSYGAVVAQYDRVEAKLAKKGYELEDTKIFVPVPHRREHGG